MNMRNSCAEKHLVIPLNVLLHLLLFGEVLYLTKGTY